MTTVTGVESILSTPESEKRVQELKVTFDTPPSYGKGLDWTGYTIHDAVHVMLLYLDQLAETIIPPIHHRRFCEPLMKHSRLTVGNPSSQHVQEEKTEAMRVYHDLIAELPIANRHVFLFILDLLAIFTREANTNTSDTTKLVALFQPSLLNACRYDTLRSRVNQQVLVFLICNHKRLVLGMSTTGLTDEPLFGSVGRTGAIEFNEAAQQAILPEGTSPDVPPSLSATVSSGPRPTSDTAGWKSDSDVFRDILLLEDRAEVDPQKRSDYAEVQHRLAHRRADSSDSVEDPAHLEPGSPSNLVLDGVKNRVDIKSSLRPSKPTAIDQDRSLVKSLGHYFIGDNEPRVEYSESEISDISQLLLRFNPSWSRIPRVYIILRIIGCLHVMSTFVDVGFSDYDLPVTAKSLPPDLNPKARSDFVKNQTMVMTIIKPGEARGGPALLL